MKGLLKSHLQNPWQFWHALQVIGFLGYDIESVCIHFKQGFSDVPFSSGLPTCWALLITAWMTSPGLQFSFMQKLKTDVCHIGWWTKNTSKGSSLGRIFMFYSCFFFGETNQKTCQEANRANEVGDLSPCEVLRIKALHKRQQNLNLNRAIGSWLL